MQGSLLVHPLHFETVECNLGRKKSKDRLAVQQRRDRDVDPCENLKHQLNVLLKRGVHGLYLFAVDKQLQEKLSEVVHGNKLNGAQ